MTDVTGLTGSGDHLGELLSALVDGELSPDDEGLVEEHLATCPACRAERDQLAELRRAVRGLPRLDMPPPVWVQVMRAGRGKARRPAAWVGAAGAAAAAVALLGLAATPTEHHHVAPQMAHLVQIHAASSGAEPVTGLAPAAVKATFVP